MKNVEIINVKKPLLNWTIETLRQSENRPDDAEELIQGLVELMEGKSSFLMIGQGEAAEQLSTDQKIRSGSLTISAISRQVIRDGTEIMLTPKEFDILYFLAKNRGEVFTKEQIYQAVWDDKYLLDDSNIMAFIRKIRKKIEPNPDAPQYILTIWGVGYKFNDQI